MSILRYDWLRNKELFQISEAKKQQKRNWEENDYYDSDEDSFLDRTGDLDKKREKRMRKAGKIQDTVETYDSLVKFLLNFFFLFIIVI